MDFARMHILLVEDNPADARLVRELLADAGTVYAALAHVTRLDEAIRRLGEGGIDVVLLDLSLPDGHGLDTVTRVHASAPHVPIVVMSGLDDEETAIRGVREGAQDYLVKGRVDGDLLARSLHYAIERKRIQDHLDARTRALEEKTREQEAFIYTVSHDLKAPLVSLQGMAQILVEDYGPALDDEARLYIDRIIANAQKMQALLNDLLDMSRVGRVDVERVAVDLDGIVRAVLEQMEHTLKARGAVVSIEGSLPVVYANATRMMQVFTNLIDNAVKYTPRERTPRVRVSAADAGGCWEICVQDNGVGIPSEFHDKIVGLFQRLPQGKALHPGGTGVGLAIVARIVQLHGGKLWIESTEGAGSIFHVSLPKVDGRQETVTGPYCNVCA